MTTELERTHPLVDVTTGEIIERSDVARLAETIDRYRDLKRKLDEAITELSEAIGDSFASEGKQTLRAGAYEVKGGQRSETVWDVEKLQKGLRRAGLSEDRLAELVTEEVSYKVNGSVARQLAGANPAYERVIKRAKTVLPGRSFVSVKRVRAAEDSPEDGA